MKVKVLICESKSLEFVKFGLIRELLSWVGGARLSNLSSFQRWEINNDQLINDQLINDQLITDKSKFFSEGFG